jgi:alpha-glucosidase
MAAADRAEGSDMDASTASQASHADETQSAPWWRGAVIYQIYPLSFMDANGDGFGDLKGCIERLDYVASLGVDAIWLSPFYTSPLADFGYDIANHCEVDRVFGDMADAEALIAAAHARGLKIILDLVASHTSDKHAWFLESRESRTNAKADWYVWADPKPDGAPPNNWQSVFGGPSWEWNARRRQYYLHNFLTAQPDLNLHNQDVQDAILEVARFWLDKGVDGFRVDAINFAMHDPLLRDNPPSHRAIDTITRPFDMQAHVYNQSHSDIPKFLNRLRRLIDRYPDRFTVAEVGGQNSLHEMKLFTGDDRHLHSAYDFSFLYADSLTPARVADAQSHWLGAQGEGWPSWAFSNHDAPRHVSRWADGADTGAVARASMMLLLSLRGNAFIYQGEELGLPQGKVAFADLKDPEAIANWPRTLGRDGARTPMPWKSAEENLGFGAGKPWLPASMNHANITVEDQEKSPGSCLNFTRQALAARRHIAALRSGDFRLRRCPDGALFFTRMWQGQEAFCLYNLTNAPISVDAIRDARLAFSTHPAPKGDAMVLPPWSGFWYVR